MHASFTVTDKCNKSKCGGHGECVLYDPKELSELYECICDAFYTGQHCQHYISFPTETLVVALILVVAFAYFLLCFTRSSCCGNKKENTPRVRVRLVDFMNNKNSMEKRFMKEYYKQKMEKLPKAAKEVLIPEVKDDEMTICARAAPGLEEVKNKGKKDEKENKVEKKEEKKEDKKEEKKEKKKSAKSVKSAKKQKDLIGAATTKEIKKATGPGVKISNEADLAKQKEEVNRLTEKVNSKLAKPEQVPRSKENGKEPQENNDISSVGDMPADCPPDKKEFEEKTKQAKNDAEKKKSKSEKKASKSKPKSKPKSKEKLKA